MSYLVLARKLRPQTFDEVVINESGNLITRYQVQYWNGSTWLDLAAGTACGEDRQHSFQRVTAAKCRLYISQASQPASIAEFQIRKAVK